MSTEYTKTGLEWDEKREKEFKSLTKRLERSLVDIEKSLNLYKTKPTIELLAKLSKCSKGALRDRAGKHESGWPLSDLNRIQDAWRFLHKGSAAARPDLESNSIKTLSKAQGQDLFTLDDLKKRVRKYMMENSRLIYELSEIKEINRQQAKSIESMDNRRKALEEENAELKQKLLNRKNSKLRAVK